LSGGNGLVDPSGSTSTSSPLGSLLALIVRPSLIVVRPSRRDDADAIAALRVDHGQGLAVHSSRDEKALLIGIRALIGSLDGEEVLEHPRCRLEADAVFLEVGGGLVVIPFKSSLCIVMVTISVDKGDLTNARIKSIDQKSY
jgi:hypothetical protein